MKIQGFEAVETVKRVDFNRRYGTENQLYFLEWKDRGFTISTISSHDMFVVIIRAKFLQTCILGRNLNESFVSWDSSFLYITSSVVSNLHR